MFEVHQPNIENMQEYLTNESQKGEGSSTNWWSIPAGMSSVRILPPWDPTGRVALPVYMHPIEHKGKDMAFTKYNWTCVNKTFNKPCPICEGLANLSAAGVDTSNWDANRRQFYFNAIVMVDPTYNAQKNTGTAPGTHVLMKAPKTFYDWVIAQITNPMIGDITSLENGIDVYITKEGQGLGTTYSMTLSPNGRTAIPKEYLEKITNLYNLDDIFSVGFEQAQVDELIDRLRSSAGAMSQLVPNMQQQMAGYQQSYAQPQQMPTASPAQFAPSNMNTVSTPIAANPYTANSTPPTVPTPPWEGGNVVPSAPTAPPAAPTNVSALPKCYGNYDAGNVNCVVCPHEIQCSQSK